MKLKLYEDKGKKVMHFYFNYMAITTEIGDGYNEYGFFYSTDFMGEHCERVLTTMMGLITLR